MVLIKFSNSYIINRCVLSTRKCGVRCLSFNSVKDTVLNCFRSKPSTPPYNHICQVGDPVLRTKASPVNLKIIETSEFQTILQKLSYVIKKYDMMGLAAPQIGMSLQIFAIEVTKKQVNDIDPEICKTYEVEPIPLTYFINPTIQITNPTQIICHESCGSVTGFSAAISRAKEVEVKAYDQLGNAFSWKAKGWAARLAQHEYDHLLGKLYIDKMDPTTFECPIWEMINLKNGRVTLTFKS